MSKYMTNISAKALLDSWLNKGLVSQSEGSKLENFIVSQQQEKELALYLRAIVGIGAFIASLCFIGFLGMFINFNSEGWLMLWGIIFIRSALFLAKNSNDKDSIIKHSFLIQLSFCSMGVGKILFVMGFAKMFGSKWGITLATLLITIATYHVYRMSIDRFLSTLAIFISLFINVVSEKYFGTSKEVMLNLFFFIQITLAVFLLTNGRVKRDYIPLAYATAFSLCITVIYFSVESKIGHLENKQAYNLTFINSLLTLSLVGLICWAVGSLQKLKNEPLMLALLGAVFLGIISAPGVILSICLMVLGYAKHEKLLLVMGILLMPIFIFLYYYNLDISLMAKSGVLIGSGTLLLLGHWYMAAKHLDRQV